MEEVNSTIHPVAYLIFAIILPCPNAIYATATSSSSSHDRTTSTYIASSRRSQ